MVSVHGRKEPFNCNSCDLTFEDKNSLKSHTELVHERKKPNKSNIWSHFEILTQDLLFKIAWF